jgi:hypothetical protein
MLWRREPKKDNVVRNIYCQQEIKPAQYKLRPCSAQIPDPMTMPSDQTPAASSTLPSPPATVADLVAVAEKHAGEQLTATVNRMVAVMLDVTEPGGSPYEVRQRIKSGNLLKSNSYAFIHLASTALGLALRKAVAQLTPAPSAKPVLAASLSLVPLEEMDSKVAFGAITRPFDIAHSEALATLCVRLGMLLGRDILRAEQNPFRPEVFLVGLHDAWREFEPDAGSHEVILPLLRPDIVFDFGPMLEALNQSLVRKGQGRGAGFKKTDGTAAAKAAKASRDAALADQLKKLFGADVTIPVGDDMASLIPELPNMPQGQGGWRPSAATGFDMAGAPQQAAAGNGGNPSTAAAGAVPVAGASGFPAAAVHAGGGASVVVPVMYPAGGVGIAAQGVHAGGTVGNAAPGMHPVGGPGFGAPGMPPGVGTGFAAQGTIGGGVGSDMQGVPATAAPLLELLGRIQLDALPMPAGAQLGVQAAGALPHQVFYLPRLKQSLPTGSLSRSDESTLDLLSRIFETVFLDDSIPQPTRELIQSLQIPVLKAALRDKNFFYEEAHPARRMIDLLSNIQREPGKDGEDPLYQALRRSVEQVGRDQEGQPEAFAQAVAELEKSISAEEQAAEAAIAGPISKALKQERHVTAVRSAQHAVALRVGGSEVVAVVGAFLEHKWTTVLTLAYTIEDDKPGAVDNATRTMDDLIWSVKPKATQEQRKALIARLPGLLATLNKWLDAIKWQDAERLQFFAHLAECHAAIVRAPIDASPERQFELAVEAAQQDALRRVAQENAVAEQEHADKDQAELALDGLERGAWLEFAQADGGKRKLKLAWVSPLRSLFIFSTGTRGEAFSMPAEKLGEALRAGKVTVVALEGVVGRVLSEALRDAAINDDDCTAAQAA